jgi:hypothetical protein
MVDSSILEIRVRETDKNSDQMRQEVRSAIDTRQSIPADIHIDEIRVIRNGEPIEPVRIED